MFKLGVRPRRSSLGATLGEVFRFVGFRENELCDFSSLWLTEVRVCLYIFFIQIQAFIFAIHTCGRGKGGYMSILGHCLNLRTLKGLGGQVEERIFVSARHALMFTVGASLTLVMAFASAATAQDTNQLVRILDASSGGGINIETRKVTVGGFQPGWWSAQWWLLPAIDRTTGVDSTSVYIVNRWMKEYLSVDNGVPTFIRTPAVTGSSQTFDSLSYLWNIEPGDMGNQRGRRPDGTEGDVYGPLNYHIKHRQTGKYLISQNGVTVLSAARGKPWRISSAFFPSSIPYVPLYKAPAPAPVVPVRPTSPTTPGVNAMPPFFQFLPGQRFIRILEKSSARGLVANGGLVQTGVINGSALDNQWVILVPSSLNPSGQPPNYAANIINRWTRANLSIGSGNIVLGPTVAPGAGSPVNINDLWDIQVAETGIQRRPHPDHGGIDDVNVPVSYHLKHRASGTYLVSVNGTLQSSNTSGAPWRLIEVPNEELQKAQYDPGNIRKGY